jgi:heptosyltransferase-1
MGDIIHALPAVASLKHSFPSSHLTWLVEAKWQPLLEGNPFIDHVALLERSGMSRIWKNCRELRASRYDFAVDFQGLLKSALLASMAQTERIFGFHQSLVREWPAALFYSTRTLTSAVHKVEQNLDLASTAGAASLLRTFAIPTGRLEGPLPSGDFVLASPLAGWKSKQWPLPYFASLAKWLRTELGMPLVLNGPPEALPILQQVSGAVCMTSGLPGLIDATRNATLVVGVDSGPMHLAAALGKPGVAIFGPTDPARNGPYGDSLTVLRSSEAVTSYKRGANIDPSMRLISPDAVFRALKGLLSGHPNSAGCCA